MRDWCIVPRDKFNAEYRGCGFRLIGILVRHPDYSDAELLAKEHWWHSTEVTGGNEDFIFTAYNTCYSLVGQTTGIRPVMHGNIRKFCQSELDVLKKYIRSVDVPLIIRRGLQMIMKNPLQEESVPIATTCRIEAGPRIATLGSTSAAHSCGVRLHGPEPWRISI